MIDLGGPANRGAYPRPVPTVGDRTSAAERAHDPAGWAMPDDVRDALHSVIDARRDIRRYRADPVPAPSLRRILEAAHAAPSVGHSQPWRFIVVREQKTRDHAALLADRERHRQAEQLTPDRRRRLLDLQLEGIREAPLGVVVACDRRTPAAGVLGRATFPDTDLWSCACAIQNLWLAARAEGLGVGWVTLFPPDELAALLKLPAGVQTLGWLCLGWPDERPPSPGLERAGWSKRLPLEDVVLDGHWPQEGPAAPISHLADPADPTPPSMTGPEPTVVVAARDEADRRLSPVESLGVLDRYVDKLLALDTSPVAGGTLVLVGADHPVAALGVSAYSASVTRDVLRATVAGESLGAAAARRNGLGVITVDALADTHGVPGAEPCDVASVRGDLVHTDALNTDEAHALLTYGQRLGERAARCGPVALGEVGIGNTTVAAALTCGLLQLPAEDGVGLGASADAAITARKTAVVSEALARYRATGRTGPMQLLASLGGADAAILAGVTLGASASGAAVILDGLLTSVAALIATRLEPSVARYLVAGQRSREKAHAAVLRELGLESLLDLRLRCGEGVGACLATGLLMHGIALRREVGTTHPDRLTLTSGG